jgi:hypothetical protein
MTGGVLAVAETREQATLAARRYPQATIVALTAAVDAWREREGRTDPTIEDLLDERLLGEVGVGMTDIVEAVSARVLELSRPLLRTFDLHGDLTLRAFFHYLKTHLDGVVIRVEQACAVVDAMCPDKVLVFDAGPWRMTGLTCLDKPALGLMQHVLKRLAETRGIDVEILTIAKRTQDSVEDASVQTRENAAHDHAPDEETPAAELSASASLPAPPRRGVAERLIGRLRRELANMKRRQGEIGRCCVNVAMSEPSSPASLSIAPSAATIVPAEHPYLVLALFVDLGPAIGELWRAEGGRIIAPQNIPAEVVAVDRIADVEARCRDLWSFIRNDREISRLLHHRGVDLRDEMFQQLEPIVCERFPALWADILRYDGWFATHYILARVAARHGIPVVSYHNGGFHGFSLIPIHERYDRAECDYFVCGGPLARDTFAVPPAEARWRDDVRRARPVPLGAPWIADLVRRARGGAPVPRPVKRVMVVLNALLGDCRYLGRVFPPEIAYWRFTRRLVERLVEEPLEIIVKPPLLNRYAQQRNPVEDWLEERRYPNVSILREVPLADCLDQADAFLLESPSTPLPHIAATRSALLLYVDRDVYRLVPAARDLLARRCAVLGENEEEFFIGL